MTAPLVSNVSDTARWVASHRADESARPDALFVDPYAERLAGERGRAIAARVPRWVRNGWPIVVRTKALDDFVLASVAEGCDGVLCLAAGFDTRPYRLPLPRSLRWVEADLPAITDEKAAALEGETPRCELVREKVDLADPATRRAFLDRALQGLGKALVVTEGLLLYLEEPLVRTLAQDLARPEIKWWAFDLVSPRILRSLSKGMRSLLVHAPLRFAPPDGVAFFEALGWRARDIQSGLHAARRLHRLPWLLNLIAALPLPEPNPRSVARAPWSATVRLER